jgi:hypothetical protein
LEVPWCNRANRLQNPIIHTIRKGGLPSPLLVVMVVIERSPGINVANIGN